MAFRPDFTAANPYEGVPAEYVAAMPTSLREQAESLGWIEPGAGDITEPVTPPGGLFACPYCGAQFGSTAGLAAHLSAEHPNLPGGVGDMTTGFDPYAPMQASPYAPGSPEWMEERYAGPGDPYGRWAGFGTALGLYGRQQLAPYERYMVGQQPQLESLYNILGRWGGVGGQPEYAPGMFSQWAPQYAQNPFAMYGMARGMLGDVFGMTPEQSGMAYGGGGIGNLLQMALRPQLGKQAAGWMGQQMPIAQEQWQQQYPGWVAGGGQPTFIDYIKEKYKLGEYL